MKKSDIQFLLQVLYKEKDKPNFTTSTDKEQLNRVIKQLENQLNKQRV